MDTRSTQIRYGIRRDEAPPPRRGPVETGILAGLTSGLIMAATLMVHSEAFGQGLFTPLYLFGAVFTGVSALVAGPGVAVAGALVHLATSMLFGVIFSLLTQKQTSPGAAFGSGVIYGIVLCAFMTYVILPAADPTLYERVQLAPGNWFIEHLIYGSVLFLTPLLRLPTARRKVRTTPDERDRHEEPPYRRTA